MYLRWERGSKVQRKREEYEEEAGKMEEGETESSGVKEQGGERKEEYGWKGSI